MLFIRILIIFFFFSNLCSSIYHKIKFQSSSVRSSLHLIAFFQGRGFGRGGAYEEFLPPLFGGSQERSNQSLEKIPLAGKRFVILIFLILFGGCLLFLSLSLSVPLSSTRFSDPNKGGQAGRQKILPTSPDSSLKSQASANKEEKKNLDSTSLLRLTSMEIRIE